MPSWETSVIARKLNPNQGTKLLVEFPPGTVEKGDRVVIYFHPKGTFSGGLAPTFYYRKPRTFPRLVPKDNL